MKTIFFLLIVIAFQISYSASSYGLDAFGEESWPLGAREAAMGNSGAAGFRQGISVLNPARAAYDVKTFFSATLAYDETMYTDNNNKSDASTSFRFPLMGMSIPAGFLGNIGFTYWQRYNKDFEYLSKDEASGEETQLEFKGGMFELIPSWAFRFPGLFRSLAFGVNYHLVLGNEHSKFSFKPGQGTGSTHYEYIISNMEIHDEVSTRSSGGYFGYALQYHMRAWDFMISVVPEHTIDREYSGRYRMLNIRDSIVSFKDSSQQKIPMQLGASLAFRPTKRHGLNLDFFQRNWNGDEYLIENRQAYGVAAQTAPNLQRLLGIGYEYVGSGRYYDPYLVKTSYRGGLSWQKLYTEGAEEFAASLGAGLPVGKRGALFDFAIRGGLRDSNADLTKFSEPFYGLNFTFSGLSNWGESSRRRR
jgi:long-chain fatty acid transport protein